MKITKTINTTIVTVATVDIKDGKAEIKTSDIKLYSCNPLSEDEIAKAVRKIDPKANIVQTEKNTAKYAVNIEKFVELAHVEQ